MSQRWLVKTDPDRFAFEDLGQARRVVWNDVRSPLAQRHLRLFARGDEVLVYHAGRERAVVGLASCVRGPYPDPDADDPRRVAVDLRAGRPLARPVPLRALREDETLAAWELVRIPRLTVLPVPAAAWRAVLRRGRSTT